MTSKDEQYWRLRASQLIQAQVKLKYTLHELMELMPQTRGLHSVDYQELRSFVDDIIYRIEQGEIDTNQGVDEFFERVFDSTQPERGSRVSASGS